MPIYRSWNDLVNKLQKAVNSAQAREVSELIKNKMKQEYNEEVYSYNYDSTYRDRRNSLIDNKNIVSTVDEDGTLFVENIASPDISVLGTTIASENQNLLSQWIEDGNITNIFNDKTDYVWTEPRPVIQNVIDSIEKSKSHIEALKKGLKRQKIDFE